jgi:alanyl-tRNA synthetase
MKVIELRKKYLDFFKNKKKHILIESASLIPENDPSTLFTSSGMQPMIPYLMGEKHPMGNRLVDSQKCFRTQDIDEVGNNRHTTFFEMLGNWSLGDYFKAEEIDWMFEFLTNELKLDPNRIYVTCFSGKKEINIDQDKEAAALWQEKFKSAGVSSEIVDNAKDKGMQNGRIFYYDENENWWSRAGLPENMPVGEPGGPDSEMFWDFDPKQELKIHENSEFKNTQCNPACDCGRFVEIGNNVFMEYVKTDKGFEALKNKNIDFGGGLERMTAATDDDPDVFNIDIFAKAKAKLEQLSGKTYGEDKVDVHAFRVILDHMRAATFLIADGALPSNKDQGYFTRRLIRRSIRYANQLGINEKFCAELSQTFIDVYKGVYVNLKTENKKITKELDTEEENFAKTIQKGMKRLKEQAQLGKEITGELLFLLFASYGFPVELSLEVAEQEGMKVAKGAEDLFAENMKQHQELSRQGAAQKFKGGLADSSEATTKLHTATHLLQAALRKVLGDHVAQKGSNITPDRLRFDFTHSEKMTDEQKQEVESMVNEWIDQDLEVKREELSFDEAKARGIIGLFEDKYGEVVKVYSAGDASAEMCGGPHVNRTGELGKFKIKKEESSSAGIRLIKATLSQ